MNTVDFDAARIQVAFGDLEIDQAFIDDDGDLCFKVPDHYLVDDYNLIYFSVEDGSVGFGSLDEDDLVCPVDTVLTVKD